LKVLNLREEINALLLTSSKERGDVVIVRLNSGGGTVTGYGLAAAQLNRIKVLFHHSC
jgi:serine protease SohB